MSKGRVDAKKNSVAIHNLSELRKVVDRAVDEIRITDVHTHLFSRDFGSLLLWGIDELLTYHYLVAEAMRWLNMPYDEFWSMSVHGQADLVWNTLFIENSPYSEACRGVLTVLEKLGMDVAARDLDSYRKYFASMPVDEYIDKVFELSRVDVLVMTNDPFDGSEREVWMGEYRGDSRFRAALRIDPLLNSWSTSCRKLKDLGYNVDQELLPETLKEIRRFLKDWLDRMDAVYMAASLPPSFKVPCDSPASIIIEECVIPVCGERNVPFAMMIGVKKLVNPALRLAGDSVGKGDINTVEYLCSKYPRNKFMVTMLARENQHELCVAARKFRNLLVFGCWWFLNNPSLVDEMTRMRFELLGSSFIPQHSDSRVLDQLIYKWIHSKKVIADVLFNKYKEILDCGWIIQEDEVKRDVEKLFGGNFWNFLNMEFK